MSASDVAANAAFTALTAGVDFDVDITDISGAAYQVPAATGALYAAVTHLTNADLTTKTVDGTGTFDVLMSGVKAHLKEEYASNRISGAEYSKAYTAITEAAMSNAVQYLISRDSAYWQTLGAQIQAQTAQVQLVSARIQLETAKAQLQQVQLEAQNAKATYALTKLKLATEGVAYDTAVYTLGTLLPQQLILVKEQAEAQRAQTMNTRSDGTTTITGAVGKQKDLYQQQIVSYERDAEVKAAKLFTDAWITQKSMDEGLAPPTGFTNDSIQTVLTAIKVNNNLD
jgi:hypothetical protein